MIIFYAHNATHATPAAEIRRSGLLISQRTSKAKGNDGQDTRILGSRDTESSKAKPNKTERNVKSAALRRIS